MNDDKRVDNDKKEDIVQENKQTEQVNQVNVEQRQEKERGRSSFYGIIAFAVFIIMAVGATFAYFTSTTHSGSTDVTAGSVRLSLDFISYTTAWSSNELIPVDTNVVQYSVERRPDATHKICEDDAQASICSLYEFEVINNGKSDQDVAISIGLGEQGVNGFTNLKAMLYEISRGTSGETGDTVTGSENDPHFAKTLEQYNAAGITDESDESYRPEYVNYVKVQNANGAFYEDFEPVFLNRDGVEKRLLRVGTTPSLAVAVPTSGSENAVLEDRITIPGTTSGESSSVRFMLVLYIFNLEDVDQTEMDSATNDNPNGGTFSGGIFVTGTDCAQGASNCGVFGKISGINDGTVDQSLIDGLQGHESGSGQGGEPSGGEPSGGEPSGGEPNEP